MYDFTVSDAIQRGLDALGVLMIWPNNEKHNHKMKSNNVNNNEEEEDSNHDSRYLVVAGEEDMH